MATSSSIASRTRRNSTWWIACVATMRASARVTSDDTVPASVVIASLIGRAAVQPTCITPTAGPVGSARSGTDRLAPSSADERRSPSRGYRRTNSTGSGTATTVFVRAASAMGSSSSIPILPPVHRADSSSVKPATAAMANTSWSRNVTVARPPKVSTTNEQTASATCCSSSAVVSDSDSRIKRSACRRNATLSGVTFSDRSQYERSRHKKSDPGSRTRARP